MKKPPKKLRYVFFVCQHVESYSDPPESTEILFVGTKNGFANHQKTEEFRHKKLRLDLARQRDRYSLLYRVYASPMRSGGRVDDSKRETVSLS